jgi:hypothetical protein
MRWRDDAFYEWKVIEGGKQRWAIAREDGPADGVCRPVGELPLPTRR